MLSLVDWERPIMVSVVNSESRQGCASVSHTVYQTVSPTACHTVSHALFSSWNLTLFFRAAPTLQMLVTYVRKTSVYKCLSLMSLNANL